MIARLVGPAFGRQRNPGGLGVWEGDACYVCKYQHPRLCRPYVVKNPTSTLGNFRLFHKDCHPYLYLYLPLYTIGNCETPRDGKTRTPGLDLYTICSALFIHHWVIRWLQHHKLR